MSAIAFAKPVVCSVTPDTRPMLMSSALIASDILALVAAVLIGLAAKSMIAGPLDLSIYFRLWPLGLLFPLVFAFEGLYSGVALSPPEELRRVSLSSAFLFLCLAAVTVSLRGAARHFTWTLILTLALTVVFIPLLRVLVRSRLARCDWWGYPAVIIGSGESVRRLVRTMKQEARLGLKPIAILDENPEVSHIEGIPVLHPFEFSPEDVPGARHLYGVIAVSADAQDRLKPLITRFTGRFPRLLVIPDLHAFSSLWVSPRSVGGMLGLEACQQVLTPANRLAKRSLDFLLTAAGGLVLLPLLAAIAVWVRLDSPGPVFFGHRRIGRGGREFRAWKFRSMVVDGDRAFAECLANSAEKRAEWEQNQKLRDDPRVTRAGRFLRATSLDELPQLWNVIRGEMSLVGPRPIVQAEVARYGENFDTYTKVYGGVTGLWQVSGRNNTSYDERVTLDTYYVRNWSVWLDLCILFQTIGVVLDRKGAY